jgi:hypothetical protein
MNPHRDRSDESAGERGESGRVAAEQRTRDRKSEDEDRSAPPSREWSGGQERNRCEVAATDALRYGKKAQRGRDRDVDPDRITLASRHSRRIVRWT